MTGLKMYSLRPIAYAALILIVMALIFLTKMDMKTVMSIALIMLFLIIFTYIFKTDGSKTLKVWIILFTFFGLPLFILLYLGIFNFTGGIWTVIIPTILTLIYGAISIFVIIELNYVEISH